MYKMSAVVRIKTNDMSHEQWLKERRKGIGGSDISGILNLSPWSNPIHVYMDKIGELPQQEQTEAMYFGNILEDIVAKEFQKRTGMKVRRRNAILQHPDYDYMFANVDRIIVGKREGLECKTTNSFAISEWEKGKKIPKQYFLQCQWYMAITGYKKWHIAVLIGNTKFHIDEIQRDDELIEIMIDRAKDFWENHVLKQTPPEFDGSRASEKLLKRLYPESEGYSVKLSNSYLEMIERYDVLKKQEKDIREEIKSIENKIKGEMKDAEVAELDNRKITWKTFERTTFDRKAFQKEHPELARKYEKKSSYRRFKIS